ncbi:MAG: hypothetical protein ACOVNY_09750 [Chitinophagaceae bacterium]
MKKLAVLLLFFACINQSGYTQAEIPMPKVPLMRQLFHANIDEAQKRVAQLSPKINQLFAPSNDESINQQLHHILQVRINNIQAKIELDSTLSENEKFIWLRGTENLLTDFAFAYELKNIKGILLGDVIIAFENALKQLKTNQSIATVIDENVGEIGSILTNNILFKSTRDIKYCKDLLVLKICKQYPDRILKILTAYPDVYFADSLIKIVAYNNQEELYNYAATPNALGQKIQSVNDPLVKTIGLLAYMKTGRMYFPFLDQLYRKQMEMDSITKVINNPEKYFSQLAKTQIAYAERLQKGDTPLVHTVLTNKLKEKAIDIYIDTINALHDEKSDVVRFKKVASLSPQELYYLCVLGEEEIYTSSYLGLYKRIFERMVVPKSDSLLQSVHFHLYKKFLKMAAGFNQLDDFLNKMSASESDKIMKSFVDKLAVKNTLEDAVDVADSYASITNVKLKKLIIQQVEKNLNESSNNKRSQTIYKLLHTIFLSMDSSNKINLTTSLGINPIFEMPISILMGDNKSIIVQQFFYGDKDGTNVFNAFLARFRNANWSIQLKPEWVEVKSKNGTPVSIYANRPLDETKDLDAQAQLNLSNYLDSLGYAPTIVIHRGHSYYVKSTIQQIAPSAKIILLGSCGGYQSLNKVLNICPEAHIISSKQVGTGVINQGMITTIMEQLRLGKTLNWPNLWKNFATMFGNSKSKEQFDDYVPPHKNLGAIFIMAYDKAIEANNN